VRSWQDNRTAINGLWPMMQLTDEEKRLWHDDLSGLNQDVLYDAIRNVKRSHDTLYPQIKWIRDEYRHLDRARRAGEKQNRQVEPRDLTDFDEQEEAAAREELRAWIDTLTPDRAEEGRETLGQWAHDKRISLATGFRLGSYMNDRLGLSNGGRIE